MVTMVKDQTLRIGGIWLPQIPVRYLIEVIRVIVVVEVYGVKGENKRFWDVLLYSTQGKEVRPLSVDKGGKCGG